MTEAEFDDLQLNKELGINLPVEDDDIDVDEALDLIEQEQKEIAEKKDTSVMSPATQPEISVDDITRLAMESYKDIQKKSDEIYDAFYGDIVTGRRRDDTSKLMLTDSQRLKIESINALASLANAKAKLIAAQNKAASGNVGVFIDTKSGSDVGINLANLGD